MKHHKAINDEAFKRLAEVRKTIAPKLREIGVLGPDEGLTDSLAIVFLIDCFEMAERRNHE